MVFIGNAISAWYVLALHESPPVSWADPFYLSDSLLTLAALLSFPLARRTRLERLEVPARRRDGAGGRRRSPSGTSRSARRRRRRRAASSSPCWRSPIRWRACWCCWASPRCCSAGRSTATGWRSALLVTGVSVGVVADLTFNLVQLEAGGRSASWADAVFLFCYVMLIGSAERYWRRPVARRTAPRCRSPGSSRSVPLPYLAVGTTYALLLVVALRPWTDPISGLAIGALLVTGAGGAAPAAHACGRTCGSWPSTPPGRTRPGSARWCSTRPTSSSSPGRTARSGS